MTIQSKPPVVPTWSESGDKVQPTNAEISAGWPLTNIPPSRQRFNWVLNYLSQAVNYLMQRGLPEWSSLETYPIGAKVVGPDGEVYNSLTANSNKTPSANPSDWELWFFGALASTASGKGASKVGYLLNQSGAVPQTVFRRLSKAPRFEDLITDATTDHTSAFQQMMANGGCWRVGPGPFTVSGEISIPAGIKILFEGTVINHDTTTQKTFEAIDVDNWGLYGNVTVVGSGNSTGTACALFRQGGNRFDVHNFVAKNVSGWGFLENPGTQTGMRGDQGNYVNCRSYDCWVGREDVAGSGGEYNQWVNYSASGCGSVACITSAGNNVFHGGSVVDNANGVLVQGGSNSNHGMFIGMNINHNTGYNIKLLNVTNGETFNGCHCYGDSTSAGIIWLVNSQGFQFIGGTLDASIACDGAIGYSLVANNYCPDSGNADVHGGSTPKKVIYRGNVSPTGLWKLNDRSALHVEARRSATAQTVTTATTTLIHDTEVSDSRDCYNPTTGVFTAPWAGKFRVTCNFRILGTGLSTSYVTLYRNAVAISFAPITDYTAGHTTAVCNFTSEVECAAGDTLTLQTSMQSGTDMVYDQNGSLFTITALD